MLLCIRKLAALLLAGQRLPQHVALIMDGNRRFADQLRLKRIDGHKQGYNKMKQVVQWCLELGISYVSLYAFSIDNFKRPQEEVEALMELARLKFEELLHDEDARKWQAEVRVIGDLSQAPPAIQAAAARLMQGSKEQQGPTQAVVNICFSYTSTEELQHSVQQICSGVQQSELLLDDITPSLLQKAMHTRDCPPVDLLIRTSGEQRLSDFLLWQSSHALLHWEPCCWPVFGYHHFLKSLLEWQQAAPVLAQLRAAAEAVTDAEVAAQQQAAASLNGACSPPRVAWSTLQDFSTAVQDQLQQSLQQLQQEQQQRQWWGTFLFSKGSSSDPSYSSCSSESSSCHSSRAGAASGSSSGSSTGSCSSPVGKSPERASSMALSMISEEEATCCPHPSQQLRVDSYVRRLEQQYVSNLQMMAAS